MLKRADCLVRVSVSRYGSVASPVRSGAEVDGRQRRVLTVASARAKTYAMYEAHRTVLDGFRTKLAGPRAARAFIDDLESRVRQLLANMVDGRVLPKPEADALRAAVMDFVRSEALPKLSATNSNDAIAVLDKLKAYGWTAMEGERAPLERQRAAKFPPPTAASWPELGALKSANQQHPNLCVVRAPVENTYFAEALRESGLQLPDELLALYAAHDGFDLSCLAHSPHVPVFSLLPGATIEENEASAGYPRRVVCFEGGDETELSVYCDRRKVWWVVYEYEYQPIARKPLDLRELLGFGLRRMHAPTLEVLNGELSWERYFDAAAGNRR